MAKHFSHIHNLHEFEAKKGYYRYYFDKEHDCACCDAKIRWGSSAYKCPESDCRFYLHKHCFDLPRQIPHKSHPHRALDLVAPPPDAYEHFLCDACSLSGMGFKYRCPDPSCDFDLHTTCCTLAEVSVSRGHEHPLTLICSAAKNDNEVVGREELRCGVCGSDFPEWLWAYVCKECGGYGEHVGCEFEIEQQEQKEEEKEEKEKEEEVEEEEEKEKEEEEEEEDEEEKEKEEEEEEDEKEDEDEDEDDEQEGDDEIITIRRGELRKLYGLLARKDAVIATYQMSNMRLQHCQLLSNQKRLFGFY